MCQAGNLPRLYVEHEDNLYLDIVLICALSEDVGIRMTGGKHQPNFYSEVLKKKKAKHSLLFVPPAEGCGMEIVTTNKNREENPVCMNEKKKSRTSRKGADMAFKKVLSLGLAATMTMAMGLTAFASSSFWTEYPNLTRYATDYTTVLSATGSAQTVNLRVQGIKSDWVTTGFCSTEDEAKEVTWSVVSGSTAGVTAGQSDAEQVDDDAFVSKTTATIGDSVTKGVAVVEATNPAGNYMDYTLVVNPATPIASQTGVKVKAYNGSAITGGTIIYNATVEALTTAVSSSVQYPSAMDALKTLAGDNCIVTNQYGSDIVSTLNGVSNEGMNGWQYRVYDASGKMVSISEKIGAETYEAKSGETVVWAYGSYYTNLFPTSIATN